MKFYPENYDVAVTILFTDLNGDAIVPSEITAVLYDGEDQVVSDLGSVVFDPGESQVIVTVPAAFNVLEEGQLNAARILRVVLSTDAGEIRRAVSYIIESEFRLVLMKNTFVTYESAEIIARDIPRLNGWLQGSEDERHAALVNAFNRLIRIPMKFRSEKTDIKIGADRWGYGYSVYGGPGHIVYDWSKDLTGHRDYEYTIIPREAWPEIPAETFLAFPDFFRKAVRAAQVVEAADILENDVTQRRHRQGIISETVGESSIMLRGGHLEIGLSSRALEYLSGHVHYNFRVERT